MNISVLWVQHHSGRNKLTKILNAVFCCSSGLCLYSPSPIWTEQPGQTCTLPLFLLFPTLLLQGDIFTLSPVPVCRQLPDVFLCWAELRPTLNSLLSAHSTPSKKLPPKILYPYLHSVFYSSVDSSLQTKAKKVHSVNFQHTLEIS